jgi:glycosyltransferase involved in cell wall biosynthesis
MVRIAVISTPFVPVPPPRYGGTELVIHNLVTELDARGHDVTLYATGDSRAAGDVRAYYQSAIWPPDPYHELNHVARAMYELLSTVKVDVIHANTPAALAFARMVDTPIVYTLHHDREEPLAELYRGCIASNVTMVCVSDRQRVQHNDVFRAEVVHHGLDPAVYPLGDGKGGYAAFLGRFAREKGVHLAIDAALRDGLPIRLAGAPHWRDDAYYRAEVETRLRKKGVTWIGEASHDPKVSMLGGAAATLFPIQWEEPFGLVMIESMLCGTPVLAFPRGSAAEVVEDGVTGFIVNDLEQMAAMLLRLSSGKQPFDRAACRARAAERFSARRMVDDYLAIYTMAVNGLNERPWVSQLEA